MNAQQKAFEFMRENSEAIQQALDKDLIKKYGVVVMGLARKVDRLEEELNKREGIK